MDSLTSGVEPSLGDISAHLGSISVSAASLPACPVSFLSCLASSWPAVRPCCLRAPLPLLGCYQEKRKCLSFSPENRERSSLPTDLLCFCPQELLHYLIGTLLLLVASIVAASESYRQSGLVAGAVRTLPRRRQGGIPILNAHFLPHRAAKGLFSGDFLSQDWSPP